MKYHNEFRSKRWGVVTVWLATYGGGELAIILKCEDGEPLATLSVNMYKPDCSQSSADLPPDCFYMKCWSENEELAQEAAECGLFKHREDIPSAEAGYVVAHAWQLVEVNHD